MPIELEMYEVDDQGQEVLIPTYDPRIIDLTPNSPNNPHNQNNPHYNPNADHTDPYLAEILKEAIIPVSQVPGNINIPPVSASFRQLFNAKSLVAVTKSAQLPPNLSYAFSNPQEVFVQTDLDFAIKQGVEYVLFTCTTPYTPSRPRFYGHANIDTATLGPQSWIDFIAPDPRPGQGKTLRRGRFRA